MKKATCIVINIFTAWRVFHAPHFACKNISGKHTLFTACHVCMQFPLWMGHSCLTSSLYLLAFISFTSINSRKFYNQIYRMLREVKYNVNWRVWPIYCGKLSISDSIYHKIVLKWNDSIQFCMGHWINTNWIGQEYFHKFTNLIFQISWTNANKNTHAHTHHCFKSYGWKLFLKHSVWGYFALILWKITSKILLCHYILSVCVCSWHRSM